MARPKRATSMRRRSNRLQQNREEEEGSLTQEAEKNVNNENADEGEVEGEKVGNLKAADEGEAEGEEIENFENDGDFIEVNIDGNESPMEDMDVSVEVETTVEKGSVSSRSESDEGQPFRSRSKVVFKRNKSTKARIVEMNKRKKSSHSHTSKKKNEVCQPKVLTDVQKKELKEQIMREEKMEKNIEAANARPPKKGLKPMHLSEAVFLSYDVNNWRPYFRSSMTEYQWKNGEWNIPESCRNKWVIAMWEEFFNACKHTVKDRRGKHVQRTFMAMLFHEFSGQPIIWESVNLSVNLTIRRKRRKPSVQAAIDENKAILAQEAEKEALRVPEPALELAPEVAKILQDIENSLKSDFQLVSRRFLTDQIEEIRRLKDENVLLKVEIANLKDNSYHSQ